MQAIFQMESYMLPYITTEQFKIQNTPTLNLDWCPCRWSRGLITKQDANNTVTIMNVNTFPAIFMFYVF